MAVTSGLSLSPGHSATRSPWALSLPLLIGFVVFVALANTNGLPLLADPDIHWHITVGHWILQHGAVPTVDGYSYTFTGQPWIAKEWGSQVLMALAYDAGGWSGVVGALRGGLRRHLGGAAAPPSRGHPAAAGADVHGGGLHDDGAPFPGAAVRARLPFHAVVGRRLGPRRRGTTRAASRCCWSRCWSGPTCMAASPSACC